MEVFADLNRKICRFPSIASQSNNTPTQKKQYLAKGIQTADK